MDFIEVCIAGECSLESVLRVMVVNLSFLRNAEQREEVPEQTILNLVSSVTDISRDARLIINEPYESFSSRVICEEFRAPFPGGKGDIPEYLK